MLALLATVAATLVSASDEPPWLRALVAALPGVVALANGTLKFQQKSRWYCHRVRLFEGLKRRVRDQGASIAEVSAAFSSYSQRLEDEWPGFDPLPSDPAKDAEQQGRAGATR